jgi:hypothetical protein
MADEQEDFDMQEVVSGRVSALGYDAPTKRMRAQFPNGRVAEYEGVPEEVYGAVMASPSIGQAFGSMIVNGGFPFKYV